MQQFETLQDVLDGSDDVTIANNLAVAVGPEAIFIALFADENKVVYIKVTPSEFKDMTKTVIEQINVGLN